VSVSSLIGSHIGETAALVAVATAFAVIFTVPLAALAASRQNGVADHVVRAVSVVGLALPAFWFGIVLIEVFAVHLHLLPVGGAGSGFAGHLEALVLPGLTASFAMAPILVRSLRVGMLEVMDADFIAVARAKGLGNTRVLFAHVARNALVPTVTLLGLNIAYLIGSTVIVESVFNLNGMGSLLLSSILNRDFPVVQAVTLVLGTAVVFLNLATDLLAARLDPRIRLR
jgi:peptide/nickel transport system permease protein